MDDRRKTEAIATARREIARRIARFCTSLSPGEFDSLLDRMARIQWKYEVLPTRTEVPPFGPESPDRDPQENPQN